MAFPAATAWEVRPTAGSDTNGGGFVTGSSGTDYSLQNAAQIAYTDMVIDGATNTKFTSAGNPVTAAHVGNVINVTGGTGFTVQRVYIVSQAAGVATCDKSLGTLGSTGGTGNLGGAFATVKAALLVNVTSNKIWVKATGADVVTVNGYNLNNSLAAPSATVPYNRLIGYTTTRGDGGRATVQMSTTASMVGIDGNAAHGWSIENFIVDCAALATSSGIRTQAYSKVVNCKVQAFKNIGIILGTYSSAIFNECTSSGNSPSCGISCTGNTSGQICFNYVHDFTGHGILTSINTIVHFNLVANVAGASNDGIALNAGSDAYACWIANNTVYAAGRYGISIGGTSNFAGAATIVKNNLLVGNGTAGLRLGSVAGWCADYMYDGNAFYNNAANRVNMDDTGGTNAINGSAPYTNVLDVVCSADPFTNAAGGDFTLNTTAGGGAACRGFGTPGTLPGATGTGYLDIGVWQHQDPASSGGGGSLIGGLLVK